MVVARSKSSRIEVESYDGLTLYDSQVTTSSVVQFVSWLARANGTAPLRHPLPQRSIWPAEQQADTSPHQSAALGVNPTASSQRHIELLFISRPDEGRGLSWAPSTPYALSTCSRCCSQWTEWAHRARESIIEPAATRVGCVSDRYSITDHCTRCSWHYPSQGRRMSWQMATWPASDSIGSITTATEIRQTIRGIKNNGLRYWETNEWSRAKTTVSETLPSAEQTDTEDPMSGNIKGLSQIASNRLDQRQ